MATKCYRLVGRYADVEGPKLRTAADINHWRQANPTRTVELYIGGDSSWSDLQTLRHQLSIRNLLAWALWKPVVGETLGEALIGLLQSMDAFRPARADNIADFMSFAEEQGYLHIADQPEYALAMLRVAETFRLRDLYLDSLAHCAAMGDRICSAREYERLNSGIRMVVAQTQLEVGERMERTKAMLSTFLQLELSDTQVNLPGGMRQHLDRFRQFLISFYNHKLGCYPPPSFNALVYRILSDDFACLYNLLVDRSNKLSSDIYTRQVVQTFNIANGFEPMAHGQPLLPEARGRLSPWTTADDRQACHDSLVMASNWDDDLFENDLVRAYQKFEEDCLIKKTDRRERLSPANGRKVRWMLIYGAHQTLRHATQRPEGIADDLDAPYMVTLSSGTSLPWLLQSTQEALPRSNSLPLLQDLRDDTLGQPMDIQPDMDYLNMTRGTAPDAPDIPRRSSVASATRRNLGSKIRRSMSRFRLRRTNTVPPMVVSARPQPYHEIVVQGYGNGTNQVVHAESPPSSTASRSASTSGSKSRHSTASDSSVSSTDAAEADACSTPEEPPEASALVQPSAGPEERPQPVRRRWSHQPVDRPQSAGASAGHPLTRRRSLHAAVDKMIGLATYGSQVDPGRGHSRFTSVTIHAVQEEPYVDVEARDWAAMDAFFEGTCGKSGMEQYADLGGLTEVR